MLDKREASSCGCSNHIVPLWLFYFRDHFDLPARPPVRSQHRVHLFLPAAFGYQGNELRDSRCCVSIAGWTVSHCRCPQQKKRWILYRCSLKNNVQRSAVHQICFYIHKNIESLAAILIFDCMGSFWRSWCQFWPLGGIVGLWCFLLLF